MVNRYLKCIKENDWNGGHTKIGDYLKITGKGGEDSLLIEGNNLIKTRLNRDFILMPEGWTPDNVDNNILKNLQIW